MAASSSASPPMYVGTVFGGVGTALAYGAPPAPALSSMVPNPLLAQQQQQQQQRLGDDEPSQLALHLFKNLKDKRGVTRDGQPAKKRGPKPDSKPAMSRRQELNRQAQRTHRQRKEAYIKALEEEVMRLKKEFSLVSRNVVRLAEENMMLREMVQNDPNNNNNNNPVARPGLLVADASPPPGGAYALGPGTLSPSDTSASYALHSATTQMTISSSNGGRHPFSPPLASPPQHGASAGAGGVPRILTPQGGGPPPPTISTSNGLSPYSTASSNLPYQRSSPVGPSPSFQQQQQQMMMPPRQLSPQQLQDLGPDYEQAGVDFVLTLEKPCMDHMPWLLERSAANGGKDPCGHALMASCPPEPFSALTDDIPFDHGHHHHGDGSGKRVSANGDLGVLQQQQQQPQLTRQQQQTTANSSANMIRANNRAAANNMKPGAATSSSSGAMDVDGTSAPRTWELSKADLATLLDLSQKLNLDGEITPVMAWGMVLAHPRLGELGTDDIASLAEDLTGKVRCYGFGAVMEEFEVRDALEAVFSRKPEPSGMGRR